MSLLDTIRFFRSRRECERRNREILSDPEIHPKIGLVLNLEFHLANRWVSAITPFLIDGLIRELRCIVIGNQTQYEDCKENLDAVISTEVGWSAPPLRYVTKKPILKYIFVSDPHRSPQERQQFISENGFAYLLAYYYHPTLVQFAQTPAENIVHFPWAIPDEFVNGHPIRDRGREQILVFGGSRSDAYEFRNWCREFEFAEDVRYSGVENKALSDSKYFRWLQTFDAAVAAGSLDPKYRLVVPKYFEIAATGCLLFAQEAEDLDLLGFQDGKNCVVINRENYEEKARAYLRDRHSYLSIRENGRNLILERHTVSRRIEFLRNQILGNLRQVSLRG